MFRKKSNPQQPDYEQIGRMVESIFESGYADRNKTYKMSFIKGVLGGLGGVIGATVVVAILLWILSLLGNVPFLDRITENVQDTVEQSQR